MNGKVGRPTRAGEIRKNRRMRDTDGLKGMRKRLAVDMSALDTDNYEYRFEKDDPAMLQHRHRQDWDVVEDADGKIQPRTKTDSAGSEVAYLSGTRGNDGSPERLVLLRKPKVLYDDDTAVKQQKIDELEGAMRGTPDGEKQYTPDGRPKMTAEVDN